jgi:carbamoyl-phosphate synthase large subunit
MKSVGEVMSIGRTFKEALQKGIRSLEPSTPWRAPAETPDSLLREKLATPRPNRIHWIITAVEKGLPAHEICELTKIDPWFIHQIEEIIQVNRRAATVTVETASKDLLKEVKRLEREHGTVTLLYGRKDEKQNQAVLIAAALKGKK